MADRILIIDDEVHLLRAASLRLRASGFTVETATGGLEGIEAARRQPPDLIILDIRMPDLDGFETFERLKCTPGCADVPVIFLTANAQPVNRERALEGGARFFLQKPYEPAVLLQAVHEALNTRITS